MDVRRVVRALGAHGLPGTSLSLPDGPPSGDDWTRLRGTLRSERLTGLAVAAADSAHLMLTGPQREQLEQDHVGAMAHVLRLEHSLLAVHETLTSRRISFAVLKGSAVAHLDYADPALRAFGDNDVLIPGEHFAAAVRALEEAGHTRPVGEIRPGFDARFGKGATLVGTHGHELDLHRTLAMGPFGLLVDLEELWQDADRFTLAGRDLRALGTDQRYLHACYHAVIGNPYRRIMAYRDVAEMTMRGAYDPDRVRELAVSWGAEVVLARAIRDTWDELGLADDVPLLQWARRRATVRREERLLRVYRSDASYAAKSVASLAVLPRWRDRLALVQMLALPGRAYTSARGTTALGWLVRGARRAVRDRPHVVRREVRRRR